MHCFLFLLKNDSIFTTFQYFSYACITGKKSIFFFLSGFLIIYKSSIRHKGLELYSKLQHKRFIQAYAQESNQLTVSTKLTLDKGQ